MDADRSDQLGVIFGLPGGGRMDDVAERRAVVNAAVEQRQEAAKPATDTCPPCLLFNQLHTPIFLFAVLGVVGGNRGQGGNAVRLQAVGGDMMLPGQFTGD